jgi:hypothetical protein
MSQAVAQSHSFTTTSPRKTSPNSALGGGKSGWMERLDDLANWGSDPDAFADEGIELSRSALFIANQIARQLMENDNAEPSFLVPTSEGGFTFEWRNGTTATTLEVKADGSIEFSKFVENKLKQRAEGH